MKKDRLAVIVALGASLAAAAQAGDPAAVVDAALRELARAGRSVEGGDVPPAVRAALDRTKGALRQLVLTAANERPDDSAAQLAERLDQLSRGWPCEPTGSYGSYGCVEALRVEQPEGHPDLMVATTTLSIPYGNDRSLYLLRKKRGRWTIMLEQVAHGYRRVTGTQRALDWRWVAPPGQPPFLITVCMDANELGVWRELRLRVLRIGRDAAHPRVLLRMSDSVNTSTDTDNGMQWTLEVKDNAFTISYYGQAEDPARWETFMVRRYVVRGDGVVRAEGE